MTPRPVNVSGLVQLAYVPPSTEHWKVAAGSPDVNGNVAVVDVVVVPGPPVIAGAAGPDVSNVNAIV